MEPNSLLGFTIANKVARDAEAKAQQLGTGRHNYCPSNVCYPRGYCCHSSLLAFGPGLVVSEVVTFEQPGVSVTGFGAPPTQDCSGEMRELGPRSGDQGEE